MLFSRESGRAGLAASSSSRRPIAPSFAAGNEKFRLERPQEVDEVLLILSAQVIETVDDLVRLAARAFMELDSLHQVARASVVEEKDALPNTPERSSSELIGACATLGDAVRETTAHVVDEDVGVEVHRLVGERRARDRRGAARNHLAGDKRRRVAVGAADPCENGPSIRGGRRIGRRGGWGQHPHEVGERLDVSEGGGIDVGVARRRSREVERVVGRGGEDTAWSLVALLGEELARDPHLDVIGLAREQEKGFVLCLPSEAGYGPVVSTAVHIAAQERVRVTGNAQLRLQGRVGLHVREDRRVGDRFEESIAKDRCRDAEDDVRISTLAGERVPSRQEVGLGDVATHGVTAAADDEEGVHVAVVSSVGVLLEARLPDGPIFRDEPRHHVFCPTERGDLDQGVPRRARPATSRLGVARKALVRVEARPQAVVLASRHGLDFLEPGKPILEERGFVRRKAWQGRTRTRRAAAHARVYGRRRFLTRCAEAHGQNRNHHSTENLQSNFPSHGHDTPPVEEM